MPRYFLYLRTLGQDYYLKDLRDLGTTKYFSFMVCLWLTFGPSHLLERVQAARWNLKHSSHAGHTLDAPKKSIHRFKMNFI